MKKGAARKAAVSHASWRAPTRPCQVSMAASLQMESSTTSWAGQTLCGGSVLTRSSSEWVTLVSGSQNVQSKWSHRFDLDQSINHFYCHITTARVPWWVKFLRACSRLCRNNLHIDSTYLHRRQCAECTYIVSTHSVPYQSVTFDVTSEWLTNGISPESPITFEC